MLPHFTSLLLSGSALLVAPQEATTLLARGDHLLGRPVSEVPAATIDEQRNWFALARYDDDTGLLVVNGEAILVDGQRILSPSARVVQMIDPCGGVAQRVAEMTLDDFLPPLAVPGPRTAIVRNERALVITGELLGVGGLPADARCESIMDVAANLRDTLVIQLRTGGAPTLVRLRFDADGSLLTSERLLGVGDLVDGGRVVGIGAVRINQAGDWLTRVQTDRPATLLIGPTGVLHRSGEDSGIPGRPVEEITSEYALDDFGRIAAWIRVAGSDADDLVLVAPGGILAREGEPIRQLDPFQPPLPLLDSGRAPQLELGNDGSVYWFARFAITGPPVLMRGRTPVLAANLSQIDGGTVRSFGAFSASPDGRDWVGTASLGTPSRRSLVRMDFGTAEPRPGCTPLPGRLALEQGWVLSSHAPRFVLEAPAPLGAAVRLFAAASGPAQPRGCGILSPFGELLLAPGQLLGSLPVGTHLGAALEVDLSLPSSLALVNRELFLQGAYLAPGSITLTNGLRLEVGAP